METIYNLQKRASELRSRTETDSISPRDTFGLHADTLEYIAGMERNLDSLGIRKVYISIETMKADTAPVGMNGAPLRFGQIVIIYDATNPTAEHAGEIYAYQNSGWLLIGNITNVNDAFYNYNEWIKRLQGVSPNSNPSADPFLLLGKVTTADEVNELLDGLHSTKPADKKCGSFRILFGDAPIYVENYVLYYVGDQWVQSIRGRFDLSEDKRELVLGRDFNLLWRRHSSDNGWGEWQLLTGKPDSYLSCANYGKKVQVFGGSLSVRPESEAAKDKWRELLGMEVGSCGHGGAGYGAEHTMLTPTQFVSETVPRVTDVAHITVEALANTVQNQVRYLAKSDTDIFILWLSTNDYTTHVPVGTWKDYTIHDGFDEAKLVTQCGGLNFCIRHIRTRVNAQAKIYVFTPLKFFYDTQEHDGGYNVNTVIRNRTGKSFYDYIRGAMEVCAYQGVPVFDQFSLFPVGWEQRGLYYYKEDTGYFHLKESGYLALALSQVEFLANGSGVRTYPLGTGDEENRNDIERLQSSVASLSNKVVQLSETVKDLTGESDRADRVYTRDLGNYQTFGEILSILDTLHGTSFEDNKVGRFVIALQGRPFYVNNLPLYILGDHYMQVLDGAVALPGNGIPVPASEYNILVRSHKGDAWDGWRRYASDSILTIH